MPVACVNWGRMRSSSPESWTEVVEANTIVGAATARSGISAAMTRSAARAPQNSQAGMDNFAHIIALSLGVSLCATALATGIGLSLGAVLAVYEFPGRRVLVVLCNAFFGLPPVAVGLALYLLLSRSGPLGLFGLLFTPGAMVLAQTTLATADRDGARPSGRRGGVETIRRRPDGGCRALVRRHPPSGRRRIVSTPPRRLQADHLRGRRDSHRWRQHRRLHP